MYYTSQHEVLCGLCKQEKQVKNANKMESKAARKFWKRLILEEEMAKYKKETESLCQQLKKEMAEHKVS
jgi:hypothetical protein